MQAHRRVSIVLLCSASEGIELVELLQREGMETVALLEGVIHNIVNNGARDVENRGNDCWQKYISCST
jgi:hypothetical protein